MAATTTTTTTATAKQAKDVSKDARRSVQRGVTLHSASQRSRACDTNIDDEDPKEIQQQNGEEQEAMDSEGEIKRSQQLTISSNYLEKNEPVTWLPLTAPEFLCVDSLAASKDHMRQSLYVGNGSSLRLNRNQYQNRPIPI